MDHSSTWPYPLAIAHRGAGKAVPENTLAAMRHGYRCGFGMFEFDVQVSSDGVPFLLHDDHLSRTTDGGEGVAGTWDWQSLSRLDAGTWHSPIYAGEPIPDLQRVLRYLQAVRVQADIELKPSPGQDGRTGQVVADVVAQDWNAAVPPLLSSFSRDALAAAQRAQPQLPRALLTDGWADDWQEACRALGCVALIPNARTLTQEQVQAVMDTGLVVLCYTVNDPQRFAELARWGVKGVCTDAVDRIPGRWQSDRPEPR